MNVLDLMKELGQTENKIQRVDKGILFLGNTGVGKSTLIHYLVRNPDLYICQEKISIEQNKELQNITLQTDTENAQNEEEETEIIYKIKENINNKFSSVKIGKGMKSTTSIPITVKHQNIFYRDLPGFQDNRKNGQNLDTQDLKNSFYFSQIFKKTQFLKVILVVKSAHIQGKATQFSSFISNIKERFGRLSDLQKCSLIIFGHHRDQKILAQMRLVIKLYKENKQNEQAQFVKYMLDNKNFFIFNKLNSIESVDFTLSDQIKFKLQSLEWKKNNFKNQVILSKMMKSNLGNNQQKIQMETSKKIQQFSLEISNNLKKLYDSGRKQELMCEMLRIKNSIASILGQTDRSRVFQVLKKTFEKHQNFFSLLTRFEKGLDFLDFISQINAQKPFYEIKVILNKIKDSIETRINSESKIMLFNHENDIAFQVTKKYITSKDIQKIINDNIEFNHFIFFLHEAELNSNIIAKGKNFFIFAKIFKTPIYYKVLIDLSGKDAEAIKGYANDQNGKPGYNGQNGGNLYLKVDQIIGNGLLVDLSGGKGGDGQSCRITNLEKYIPNFDNGKIFQKDCQNEEKNKVFLKERIPFGWSQKKGFEQTFIYLLKKFGTFNGQVLETYSTDTNNAYQKYYKDKIAPGDGGNPGKDGRIIYGHSKCTGYFVFFQSESKIDFIIHNRSKGDPGILVLDQYQGKFIRQLVFSALRQQGKKIDQQTLTDVLAKQVILGGLTIGGQIAAMEAVQELAKAGLKKAVVESVKQAGKMALIETGKQITKQASKAVAKQTVKTFAKQITKEAAKQVTLQCAQSVATAGLFGIGVSFVGGLLVQGIISPISAYLSSEWKQKASFKKKSSIKATRLIKAQLSHQMFKLADNQEKSLLQMYNKINL